MGKYSCCMATFKCWSLRGLMPISLFRYCYGRKGSYTLKSPVCPSRLYPGSHSSNVKNYWWRSTCFKTPQANACREAFAPCREDSKIAGSCHRAEFSRFCSWSDRRHGQKENSECAGSWFHSWSKMVEASGFQRACAWLTKGEPADLAWSVLQQSLADKPTLGTEFKLLIAESCLQSQWHPFLFVDLSPWVFCQPLHWVHVGDNFVLNPNKQNKTKW